jgi:hypothetical protein
MRPAVKIIILILLISGLPLLLSGKQGQGLVDSLLAELPGQREDTNKANLLYKLAYEYLEIDPCDQYAVCSPDIGAG